MTSEGTTTNGQTGTVPAELTAELAAEQQYVDRVYSRLTELRRTAAEVEKAGYSIAKVGNFGAYVERDAMVYHAARRRIALDAEYEGLVFGRLDMGPDARPPEGEPASAPVEPAVPGGEVRYIGRLGLRDETYESLVVDWRAPAAAPFYRATPTDRMGVVRRRTIRSHGERVVGVERQPAPGRVVDHRVALDVGAEGAHLGDAVAGLLHLGRGASQLGEPGVDPVHVLLLGGELSGEFGRHRVGAAFGPTVRRGALAGQPDSSSQSGPGERTQCRPTRRSTRRPMSGAAPGDRVGETVSARRDG